MAVSIDLVRFDPFIAQAFNQGILHALERREATQEEARSLAEAVQGWAGCIEFVAALGRSEQQAGK